MSFTRHAIVRFALLLQLAMFAIASPGAHAALGPGDLLLVVNVRIPASRALAELYARQRHIPIDRICEIEVPSIGIANPPEEIPFDAYEHSVAQPVRAFINRAGLQAKVKCIVTFWGVPFRIGARRLTPEELEELPGLQKEFEQIRARIDGDASALEKSAKELNPEFKTMGGNDLPPLTARLQAAMNSVAKSLPTIKDPTTRNDQATRLTASLRSLLGNARTTEVLAQPALIGAITNPPSPVDLAAARTSLANADRELGEAQGFAPNAAHRTKVRELAAKSLGKLGVANILSLQIETFRVEQSAAALDNELALLWWQSYPRAMWISNPLYWQNVVHPGVARPPTLMVSRIDGPSEIQVRNLIKTSSEIEQQGLRGEVVLDARGKLPTDAYGQYDQSIRNVYELIHTRTTLKATLDDQEQLIPIHSIKDPIAIYCGWYSLRNYFPPGPFAPGAVGFHVASFEMVSLRARGEHGWVHGLLSDGVDATVGPVAEPYLHSFPRADEFFPLLLTGKLTLAEVYWLTNPLVSWMQACIADPLYTPFKTNPALKVEDLPPQLRALFIAPATSAPTSSPSVR